MKKILSLTLLVAVSMAFFALMPVQAENNGVGKPLLSAATSTTGVSIIEKISAPDQIKYFRVIKKQDGALWGIRLTNDQGRHVDLAATTIKQGTFEKIIAPQFISLYNNIKKIGTSLWGIPKKLNDNRTATSTASSTVIITPEVAPCVSTAIDKKDTAIKVIVTTSAKDINAAIDVRNTCQKTAIATTTDQIANLKICIKNFQNQSKEIALQANTVRQEVWKTYQNELKACLIGTSATSTATLMIEDGGLSIFN